MRKKFQELNSVHEIPSFELQRLKSEIFVPVREERKERGTKHDKPPFDFSQPAEAPKRKVQHLNETSWK